MSAIRSTCFAMVLTIGAISAFDCMASVVTFDTLKGDEANPVASLLIATSGVEGMVMYKAAGTLVAVLLMLRLGYTRYRVAIVPVFLVQCLLFLWLNFATEDGMVFRGQIDPFSLVKLVIQQYFKYYADSL